MLLIQVDNTLDNPASSIVEPTRSCPSVPKTFLNRDTCKRTSGVCSPTKFKSKMFALDDVNLRKPWPTPTTCVFVIFGQYESTLRNSDVYE